MTITNTVSTIEQDKGEIMNNVQYLNLSLENVKNEQELHVYLVGKEQPIIGKFIKKIPDDCGIELFGEIKNALSRRIFIAADKISAICRQ